MADGSEIDFEALKSYLSVLGYENRLELLTILREPRTIDEIELTPTAPQAGDSPDRSISRQAVRNHLDRLMEIGLVRTGSVQPEGQREQTTYRTDHARLYAVVEELRRLCRVPPAPDSVEPFQTTELDATPGEDEDAWDGPRLVVVHGVREGRVFPLRPDDREPPRGWVIGRSPEADVPLPNDPFVSSENAEVVPTDAGFKLLDLRTARNGTFLNWDQLPVGGKQPLETGDVVGVGRSLLVFRSG